MVNFQNMVFQRNVQQILIGKTQNPGKIRQTVKYFLFHPVFSPGFQINQANAGIIILFQSDGRHETVITAAVRRSIDGARRVITVNVRVVQIPQRGNGDQITVQTQYLVQFRLERGNPQTKIRFLTDMGVGIFRDRRNVTRRQRNILDIKVPDRFQAFQFSFAVFTDPAVNNVKTKFLAVFRIVQNGPHGDGQILYVCFIDGKTDVHTFQHADNSLLRMLLIFCFIFRFFSP